MLDNFFLNAFRNKFQEILKICGKKNRKGEWACPFCDSGLRKNETSAFTLYDGGHGGFYCFSCGEGGDIFHFVGKLYGLPGFLDQVRKACELLGKPFPESDSGELAGGNVTPSTADFSAYIEASMRRLQESPCGLEYLHSRGFSDDSIATFRLGFDRVEKHGRPVDAIVIPYDRENSYYALRFLEDCHGQVHDKPPRGTAGAEPLFNREALWNSGHEPVFVTESAFDAISIEQLGYRAIAMGGAGDAKLQHALEARKTPVGRVLIISGDNDHPGQKNALRLSERLSSMGVRHTRENITAELGCKDANEALVAAPEKFREILARVSKLSNLSGIAPDNDLVYLDRGFWEDKRAFMECRALSTGFGVLDQRLGGGVYPGLYVLGAATSLGKTSFCHQVASHLAHIGANVLFFSLEMSKFEMISRGIAREIGRRAAIINSSFSSLNIRKLPVNDDITNGIEAYKKLTDGRLNIIQCDFGYTVEKVIEYTKNFMAANRGVATILFIDYLQILSQENKTLHNSVKREEIDAIITSLKLFSSVHKIPIFVVSSLNRGNYILPVSYESFKESGGIEYTADVVLGLQLKCLGDDDFFDKEGKISEKRKKIREHMNANPRRIELLILKNRFGVSSGSIYYDYYCNCDYFCNERA